MSLAFASRSSGGWLAYLIQLSISVWLSLILLLREATILDVLFPGRWQWLRRGSPAIVVFMKVKTRAVSEPKIKGRKSYSHFLTRETTNSHEKVSSCRQTYKTTGPLMRSTQSNMVDIVDTRLSEFLRQKGRKKSLDCYSAVTVVSFSLLWTKHPTRAT